MARTTVALRTSVLAIALAAAASLAACSSNDTSGPRWSGSFTRAISSCGAAQTPFVLDPPREVTIEGSGTAAPGERVLLFIEEDACGFSGTVAADGRLEAVVHPGCPAAAAARILLVIEDALATVTTIHQVTDYLDPQRCDVEVWGTFTRE